MNEREPDRDSPAPDEDPLDVLIAKEESAAAAEAARIGGRVPPLTDDPTRNPLYEAGEGEQEGWEEAERELIENATHGDGHGDPERDAFSPEREADRSTAAYGESDAIVSTELDQDTVDPDRASGTDATSGNG